MKHALTISLEIFDDAYPDMGWDGHDEEEFEDNENGEDGED